jgi:hypothetical protein
VVQETHHLTDQSIGLVRRARLGQLLQHDRAHTGEHQFAGQQQPDRAATHDDHLIS